MDRLPVKELAPTTPRSTFSFHAPVTQLSQLRIQASSGCVKRTGGETPPKPAGGGEMPELLRRLRTLLVLDHLWKWQLPSRRLLYATCIGAKPVVETPRAGQAAV